MMWKTSLPKRTWWSPSATKATSRETPSVSTEPSGGEAKGLTGATTQGRGFRGDALRGLFARLPALLHQQGPGVLEKGSRGSGSRPHVPRKSDRQPSGASERRTGGDHARREDLRREQVRGHGHQRRAREEDGAHRLQPTREQGALWPSRSTRKTS